MQLNTSSLKKSIQGQIDRGREERAALLEQISRLKAAEAVLQNKYQAVEGIERIASETSQLEGLAQVEESAMGFSA